MFRSFRISLSAGHSSRSFPSSFFSEFTDFALNGKKKTARDLKKEARKAFFGSFALWIFFIFAVIFIMLGQNGKPYLFKEPDPSEETPIVEPTSEQERVSETFTN